MGIFTLDRFTADGLTVEISTISEWKFVWKYKKSTSLLLKTHKDSHLDTVNCATPCL